MEDPMEELQQLRYKASELLLREEWKPSIQLYDQCVSLCHKLLSDSHQPIDPDQASKLKKSLCLAFSNCAEARSRLRDFSAALADCDRALELDAAHFKTLVCKGKILLHLNRYSMSLDCFRQAMDLEKNNNGGSEPLQELVDHCKKLQLQSRTGNLDLSQWILNGFKGKIPALAEFVGPVRIGLSDNAGRGVFATRDVEAGTLLIVTKAVATGRAILPEPGFDASESAQIVMWKDFVDCVVESLSKCKKTLKLVYTLSTGEDEQGLEAPDIAMFRPEAEEFGLSPEESPDIGRILKILDVNSLTEDTVSAKVLGKNSDYYGVGLWILPSFINHTCNSNARRLHVGDHIVIHASRDVKEGEEISFPYFDVLLPLKKRMDFSKGQWGFHCHCKRCRFEEMVSSREDLREIERMLETSIDMAGLVVKLEERMRRWMLKGKEKGFLRASFWAAYSAVFMSEKAMKRLGKRIPAVQMVVESVVEAIGGDERLLKLAAEGIKVTGGGVVEMERVLKIGRGVYGKVLKKQAIRALLDLCSSEHTY